ncbi:hypothetical protein DNTS_014551 [Danionella cerebrum]|uniref:Fatty acid-binding protein, liver n=1 Tax=Danionella cerebrum TaxID=2873325 RepID=A0A553RLV6_9TELE|nr:hypothetical protein DNTS_014551 [Danionella translucida]
MGLMWADVLVKVSSLAAEVLKHIQETSNDSAVIDSSLSDVREEGKRRVKDDFYLKVKDRLKSFIMSFTGKYQLETSEGFEQFMKAVGLPDEMIEKGKDIKSVSEIEQNGNVFKVTITTGPKVIINTFTIGQETEIETLTGQKVKTVVKQEGNKLIVVLDKVTSVTELVDANTLKNTMTLGSLVYKRTSKRVA